MGQEKEREKEIRQGTKENNERKENKL